MTRRGRKRPRLLLKKSKLRKHLYFCEKQVDSWSGECYTPDNQKAWIDRGAVCMSILHHSRSGNPGDGKRVCCRRVCVSRAYISGSYGKHPADCHNYVECYHSGVGLVLPFCRECWSFSEIRGFLLQEKKGNEKNEKNCKNDEPGSDPGYADDPDRLRRQDRSSRCRTC